MRFLDAFINKCLQVSILFCPILLWDLFLLLQLFLSFPSILFIVMSGITIILLSFAILFGNSFCKIYYQEEQIFFEWRKPSLLLVMKNIIFTLPILFCCAFFYSVPLYIYGGIQVLFMYIDKEHFTLSERVYFNIRKHYEQYILHNSAKKERKVA